MAILLVALPVIAFADDADIEFKTSHFVEKLKEKVTAKGTAKLTSLDSARLAQVVLEKEGLPYKAYLKKSSHAWSICSTTSASDNVCQTSTVSFLSGEDHCGKFGEFSVLAQSPIQWVLTTGNTPFRVPINDVISPINVILQKSEALVRSWALPQNFTASFLTPDFLTLLVKTEVGGVTYYLEVQDSGRVHFIQAPTDLSKIISLTDKTYQDVKSVDGARYQLVLPKNCI